MFRFPLSFSLFTMNHVILNPLFFLIDVFQFILSIFYLADNFLFSVVFKWMSG